MKLQVDIQTACTEPVPGERDIRDCLAAVLADGAAVQGAQRAEQEVEVLVRLVGEEEMAALNHRYRGRDAATNVLAFAGPAGAGAGSPLLGDIVICAPVVAREARRQGKPPAAHWSHMLVHGCLHLLGHDHREDGAAQRMEALETGILGGLGYPCPYTAYPNSDGAP